MSLSNEQIAYIRDKINQEGIDESALLNDLLDHICCAVEYEMKKPSDFESALNKVLSDFSPEEGLGNIQVEINTITHTKSITMKKLTFVLAFLLSLFFFVCILLNGVRLLNNYDWAFMNDLAFINQYAFCLFILPLYWLHQYRMAKQAPNDGLGIKMKLVMFSIGFLCSEALANAVFFKLMHMPGGNQLFIITAVLGMVYVPLFLFRKYRLAF
jgi:hypothetical protein